MSFLKFLDEYETKITESITQPKTVVSNPVNDKMQGTKPSIKVPSISKPSGPIANPVKTNMQGQKVTSPNTKAKNPSPTINNNTKGKDNVTPNPKPKVVIPVSPKPVVENPAKSFAGKIAEHATNILDGIVDHEVVLSEEQIQKLNIGSISKNNTVDRANSLLD